MWEMHILLVNICKVFEFVLDPPKMNEDKQYQWKYLFKVEIKTYSRKEQKND